MKVSLSWLKKYLSVDVEHVEVNEIINGLTMLGLEVESVEDRFDYLKKIVVGQIKKIKKIGNDGFSLCVIDCGEDLIEIISTAKNLSVNSLVPVALVGSALPSGVVCEKKIKGYSSCGLLCSEDSLGIGRESDKIMNIEKDFLVGLTLKDIFSLSDFVLDISLTPNRADCASVIGIAREISAMKKLEFRRPASNRVEHVNSRNINDILSVKILDTEKCFKYTAKIFDKVIVKASPFWLKNYLISVGISPVNNVVDITNFVMFEMGQPLHAFDFDLIDGGEIIVDSSKGGEKILTLDGKEQTLNKGVLTIYDINKPIAIAGVIGGINSKISRSTQKVVIESACFDSYSIRKAVKTLGISTDSSYRFERGIDPNGVINALDRVSLFMTELVQGNTLQGLIDYDFFKNNNEKSIDLKINEINLTLGIDIACSVVKELLESIGFLSKVKSINTIEVKIPSYRLDIERPEDLIEEVARLYGYDNIPINIPKIGNIQDQNRENRKKTILFKSILSALGFTEIITYSFVDKAYSEYFYNSTSRNIEKQIRILNPIASNQSIMRMSLVPGMLEVIAKNISKNKVNLRLFEIGKVFFSNGPKILPDEKDYLAVSWIGHSINNYCNENTRYCDFFDIKGALESFLDLLNIKKFKFTKLSTNLFPHMRKGHTAQLQINGIYLGYVGEFSPGVLKKFSIKERVFGFEINIGKLLNFLPKNKCMETIPKFPAVSRDTTLILNKEIEIGEIFDKLENIGGKFLETFYLLDVYYKSVLDVEIKNLTFRIVYRAQDRTLDDETINFVHKRIVKILIDTFNAQLP